MEKKKKILEIIKKVLTISSYIITGIVLLVLIIGGVNSCHSNNDDTINDTNDIEKMPKKSLVFNGDDLLEQDRLLIQGDNYVLPLTTFYSYRTHLFTSVEIRTFATSILYNTSDGVGLVCDLKIYQDLSVIYEFEDVNGINLVRTEMRIFFNNGEDYQDIYLEDTGSADYQFDVSIISYDIGGGLTGMFEFALLATCPYMYYKSIGSNTLIRAQSTFYPVYQITFENTINQNILIGQFGFNDTDFINVMTFNGSNYNLLLYQLGDLDFDALTLKSTIQAHKLKDNEYYYNIYDYFTTLENEFRYLNYFSTTYNGLVMCKQFMYFNGVSNYELKGRFDIINFNIVQNVDLKQNITLEYGQGVESVLNTITLEQYTMITPFVGLYNGNYDLFKNEYSYIRVNMAPEFGVYEYYDLKLNITYGLKLGSNVSNKIYTIGVRRYHGLNDIDYEEIETYNLSGINVSFYDLWRLHEKKDNRTLDYYPIHFNGVNTTNYNFISNYIVPTATKNNVVIVPPSGSDDISFFDIFGIAFSNVAILLGYPVLPGMTLGFLMFFPFVITILLFIISLFKR